MRRLLAIVLLIAYSSTAVAQEDALPNTQTAEVTCSENEPSKCALELKYGQVAPFNGMLMTEDLAIDLGQKALHCDERVDLAVTATASYHKAVRKFDRDVYRADRKLLEKERDLAAQSTLDSSHILVAGVTVAAMLVLFFLVKTNDKAAESLLE
jgi:hypothetical protein